MSIPRVILAALFCAALGQAQLTTEEKVADLQHLAGIYAKQYAPYEWKREALGFDLYQLEPWIDRIRRTTNDLEFYEVMIQYASALKDSHSRYSMPSNFRARLGFTVDLYDGKPLVDSIEAAVSRAYPISLRDELVSLDGEPAEVWMERLAPFGTLGSSPRGLRRQVSNFIVDRSQSRIPKAALLGDDALVVLRKEDGTQVTITMPWIKTGLPITTVGPVPIARSLRGLFAFGEAPAAGVAIPPDTEEWMAPLLKLGTIAMDGGPAPATLGLGQRTPLFAMPAGFSVRQTGTLNLEFYTGSFQSGGRRIGYIRIPSMVPINSFAVAYQQLETEMAFFNANTDGLIVDVMRNTGGFVVYVNEISRRFIPSQFRAIGFELRASIGFRNSIWANLNAARSSNQPGWIVQLWENIFNDVDAAYRENRGRTGPLPLDGYGLELLPTTDAQGNVTAYRKPLIVLTDEWSASGGDAFPATIQDARRGLIVGWRSAGAGGSVGDATAGAYGEGTARVTQSLMNRAADIAVNDLPVSRYVENVGVRPDVEVDFMTRENLANQGRPFVSRVVEILLEQINRN